MAEPVVTWIGELPLELIAGTEELRILRQPARTITALPHQPLSHGLDDFLVLIEDNLVVLEELPNRRRRFRRPRIRLEGAELLELVNVLPPRQSLNRVLADHKEKFRPRILRGNFPHRVNRIRHPAALNLPQVDNRLLQVTERRLNEFDTLPNLGLTDASVRHLKRRHIRRNDN